MFKKSISILITVCILLSCFSTVGFAEEVQEETVIVPGIILDAQFGAEDNGGFELLNEMEGASLTTEPECEGSENYLLKFTATQHKEGAIQANGGAEHIAVKLNGDEGIEFVDGRNIIIETKFKKTAEDARVYFKYNINPKDNYKEETANLFSIMALWHDGTVKYANGTSAGATDQVAMTDAGVKAYNGKYITVKTVIKGASLNADTYLYDEDGNLLKEALNISLKQPTGRTTLDPTDKLYIEEATHLKTLSFRARKAASDILVDYVKVSVEEITEIEVSEKMSLSGEFDVEFNSSTMPSNIEEYFKVYNSENELVPAEVTVNEKTLSFKLDTVVSEGDTYTLKADKESFANIGYKLSGETTEYNIKATKYIINDQFGDNDLNGWALRTKNLGTLTTEEIEENNYALKLGLVESGYIWQNNNYAYKTFDDITYQDGTDIVIKTKFKYEDTNKGTEDAPNTTYARTYFKFNVPFNDEVYGSNVFSFFEVKGDNGFAVANGNNASKAGVFTTNYTTDAYKGSNKTAVDGQWFDTIIKIHGTSQTASIYVTDEKGDVVVDAPSANLTQDAGYTDFVTTALKNLAFRLRHDTSFVWVDYVQVYKENGANIIVPEIMSLNGEFEVEFNSADTPEKLENRFEVYDEAGVKQNAKITTNGNKVLVSLGKPQREGTVYTLKFDKDYFTNIGYVFDNNKTEYSVKASAYYINENFGADDKGGFELLNALSTSSLTTEPVAENSDNYVLKYSAANHKLDGTKADGSDEHILVKLNGDAGIEYKEGNNIIVETRFKKTPDNGRAYLKHNINVDETAEEGYNLYTIASIFNGTSGVRYPQKFADVNGQTNVQVSMAGVSGYGSYNDKFVTVKAVVKGNTHKADLYFYDENGENEVVIKNAELGIPTGRENNVNDTHLRTLAFRTRNAATDVYVDYIKVYEQKTLDLDFDGKTIDDNGNMYIWADEFALETIKPYVKLVDSENNEVTITTTIKGDGSLEVNPVSALNIGAYTLKVDTTSLETCIIPENSLTVKVMDNTVSYSENFDGEHGWNLNTYTMGENTDAKQEVVTEGENNFLRVSLTKQGSLKNGVTTSYKFGENGFVMDSDAYTVIEAKMRSNGNNFRKYFKANPDYANGFFSNTRALFAMDYPVGTISYGAERTVKTSVNPEAHYQGKLDVMETYTKDKWYTVRAIFNNAERSAKYYMIDESGKVVKETDAISMNAAEPQDFTAFGASNWYNFADHLLTDREQLRYIDELAFIFRNTPSGLTNAETLDIDDVKLYNTTTLAGLVADKGVVGLKKDGSEFNGELTEGTYYPKADIEFASEKEMVLIGALYEGECLEKVVVYPFKGVKGEYTSDKGIVVTDTKDRKIKVFLWNSLGDASPFGTIGEFH